MRIKMNDFKKPEYSDPNYNLEWISYSEKNIESAKSTGNM
jgi:hypothetical protein